MDKTKILVVEDEALIAYNLKQNLKKLGYDVVATVTSGEEAIEVARTKYTDIVLMDIHLRTEMDGVEAANEIYKKYKIPVIFLSAFSNSELIEKAKKVGSFGYLVKPFKHEELNTMIEVSLDKSKMEKELAEKRAIQNKILTILSYKLGNPFSAMLSSTIALDTDYDEFTEEEKRTMIQEINASAIGLYDTWEALLEWARAKTGKIKFQPELLKPYFMGISVIQLLEVEAEKKSIEITNNIEDSVSVFADAYMLHSILRNLVHNAIKFTLNGGKIELKSEIIGEKVSISVIDNGVGITEENMSNLFKLETHYTTRGTNDEIGPGIGLILSSEFIKNHGGEIEVTSTINKGSTFTIYIPMTKGT